MKRLFLIAGAAVVAAGVSAAVIYWNICTEPATVRYGPKGPF